MKIYRASGEIETLEDTSLAGMQKAVGGYIEMVATNDGRTLIVNEDGKMNNLPFNLKASELVRGVLHNTDIILGDVIIADHNELD